MRHGGHRDRHRRDSAADIHSGPVCTVVEKREFDVLDQDACVGVVFFFNLLEKSAHLDASDGLAGTRGSAAGVVVDTYVAEVGGGVGFSGEADDREGEASVGGVGTAVDKDLATICARDLHASSSRGPLERGGLGEVAGGAVDRLDSPA